MKKTLLAMTVLVGGCFHTTGKKVSEKDLEKLIVGETDRSEIVSILGEPQGYMDSINAGNYYNEACGEKDAPLAVLTYTFTEAGGYAAWTKAEVETTSILINKKNQKYCGKSKIRNSTKSY
ncbi:MAG: hypothetical protein HRU19_03660 [Pseudobacteriovorax sp.]|nr:hypothetical protein [Pseudobacteriovorax sp.]